MAGKGASYSEGCCGGGGGGAAGACLCRTAPAPRSGGPARKTRSRVPVPPEACSAPVNVLVHRAWAVIMLRP
jgi:hypothetical protein